MAQPQLQAFGSSVRGDTTDRFELPKCNVACDMAGRIIAVGLQEKPGRRALQASGVTEASVSCGKRCVASAEWKERRTQERAKEEAAAQQRWLKQEQETLAGVVRTLPAWLPSPDNPLASESSPEKPTNTTTTPRIAPALLPSPDNPLAHQQQDDNANDLCSSCPSTRALSPEQGQQARALNSSLMLGSLSISGRDLEAIQAESERRLQAGLSQLAHARKQDHVLEELLKQWPHGAPRRALLELRAKGVDIEGLPVLGYGSMN